MLQSNSVFMLFHSFSLIRSEIVSRFYSFRESFLYYPVIFATIGLVLFLLTSRIDEIYGNSYYDDNNLIVSYLEPVFFAGSPHAARSILSTIAAGWATILGVAFSVTLITLQLSVTKYTAEIVNEFQNSRINQITLGMFILVVIFSLLVLKTVRTGEDGSAVFAPVLGVNISVYLAVIVLFVFVIFLHQISSYLKPDSLINRIVAKVVHAIKKYERRISDRKFNLGILNDDRNNELFAIRSPRQGILRSIDWKKISDQLGKQGELKQLEADQPRLILEWLSATGDHVEKHEVISKLYGLNSTQSDDLRVNKKTIEKLVTDAIFAGLDIGPARRISSDPHFGLEILRNIAVKAISQSDIDVASSCVTGLFGIYYNAAKMGRSTAVPFMVPLSSVGKFVATISTGEKDILIETLAQLSVIFSVSNTSEECKTSLAEHFAKKYTSLGRLLLEENHINAFEELTNWYSKRSMYAMQSYSNELRASLKDVLVEFREHIRTNHSYATDIIRIHLGRMLDTEA